MFTIITDYQCFPPRLRSQSQVNISDCLDVLKWDTRIFFLPNSGKMRIFQGGFFSELFYNDDNF